MKIIKSMDLELVQLLFMLEKGHGGMVNLQVGGENLEEMEML